MMRTGQAAVVVTMLLAGCSNSPKQRVVVTAGDHHRDQTPVSVELPLPEGITLGVAEVESDQGEQLGQIERVNDATIRVWWLVEDLEPGRDRTYTIRFIEFWKKPVPYYQSYTWMQGEGPDGRCMDLVGPKKLLQYVYPQYSAEEVENTKKPFHHVYDPVTGEFITKGLGGKFPHHRGIFFGYNKCLIAGETYDTWHAVNGEHQQHAAFLSEMTGPVMGGHVVRILWNDREGKPFAVETREVRAFPLEGGLLIDYRSLLQATGEPVALRGDRQHAGVQFRASQAVAENEKDTRYLRPKQWADLPPDKMFNTPEHRGLPWNAIQYAVGDRAYTVAYMSDPANPDDAEFSEREYGRFGEFFEYDLTADNPLDVHYRWYIRWTQDVTRETIQSKYEDLADPPAVTPK